MLDAHICVVGLGYVGFPLIHKFADAGFTHLTGVDINSKLIAEVAEGHDHTGMIPKQTLERNTSEINWLTTYPSGADIYIVCVPTPDNDGVPDYVFIDAATRMVLEVAGPHSILVIESTVAPGTVCERIAPKVKKHEKRMPVCYSPERVNPAPDAYHSMTDCYKLIACDDGVPEIVASVYRRVFKGTMLFNDTRVPELAKCFENMQRDVNIALMNELAMQCHNHGVDYNAVKSALATKLSSPKFHSGMVGGHCIPVDPYYLAEWYGQNMPAYYNLPLAGREVNEDYIKFIATVACLTPTIDERNILILGMTYKPDVADTRNSGGGKLYELLLQRGFNVFAMDPHVETLTPKPEIKFNIVIGAVNHSAFKGKVFRKELPLTIDCTFINAGGFTGEQLANIHNVIQL